MPYPWSAGNVLTATDLNSALAAKTDLAMTQNAQTGTSYSYALADASKLLSMSNAASNTVLVTKQATVTWVTGTQLRVVNLGAGVTTLVADTGVTINNNKALAQYQGGTLIRTASDVWTFQPNGAGGKILQVVNVLKTDVFSSTAASWVDVTGLSATITPSSTASKILVTANIFVAGTNVIGLNALWKMLRGSTDIGVGVGGSTNISGGYNFYNITNSVAFNAGASRTILDSPATVSATTYKIQVTKNDASETIYVNRRGADGNTVGCSSLTLMEVAA
jgi:hypothetical protein